MRGSRRGWLWLMILGALAATLALLVARGPDASALVGRQAPAFVLPRLSGGDVSLGQFRGRDVVLRFGSVACTTCDPDFSRLLAWQRQAGQGLEVLAIEEGQSASVVRLALGGTSAGVPVLVDAEGQVAAEYGVRRLPVFVFIDRQGVVVDQAVVGTRTGLWSQATWETHLERLRAADARTAPGGEG